MHSNPFNNWHTKTRKSSNCSHVRPQMASFNDWLTDTVSLKFSLYKTLHRFFFSTWQHTETHLARERQRVSFGVSQPSWLFFFCFSLLWYFTYFRISWKKFFLLKNEKRNVKSWKFGSLNGNKEHYSIYLNC